jgi:hypothetical protein
MGHPALKKTIRNWVDYRRNLGLPHFSQRTREMGHPVLKKTFEIGLITEGILDFPTPRKRREKWGTRH